MDGNMTAPVREGEELDVTIEAIGDKGDGIAKKDGFVLVIPGANINQKVRIRITKVLRKVGFAELVGDAKTEEPVPKGESLPIPDANEKVPDAEQEPLEDSEDFGSDME